MLTMNQLHRSFDGPIPRHIREAVHAEQARRHRAARTQGMAAVLRADVAGLEARIVEDRHWLRVSVRCFREALSDTTWPAKGRECRIEDARAAILHNKEMIRIHAAKLADARAKLADVPATGLAA